MFPLHSPHLFHASSTSPTGEGSLEPIFVPSDCLTLSPLPPSLSSWGVAVEEKGQGCSILSALVNKQCEPQFPQCKTSACPHPFSVGH